MPEIGSVGAAPHTGALAPTFARVNTLSTKFPPESVTRTVTLPVLVTVAVPATTALVAVNVIPDGRVDAPICE